MTGPSILLIEPDKLLADSVTEGLRKDGYRVDWQVDPQVALDSADKKVPDAVILDLVLANRSGVEFLYEFRSYPEWHNVPLVLFSSLSPEDIKETLDEFEHLNITAYLYKPTSSISQLRKVLDKALQPISA